MWSSMSEGFTAPRMGSSDAYGWFDNPNNEDDAGEFSVMDLMRAGGMSLENAYSALFEEDLGTFCAKLSERTQYVAAGLSGASPIHSDGTVDVCLVEQQVMHTVPAGLECIPVGICESRNVDLVDACEDMETTCADVFRGTLEAACIGLGEHLVVATAWTDGSLRTGDGGLVESHPRLDTAIVSVRGEWDERHVGIVSYLSGLCRGMTMAYSHLCPLHEEHVGQVPGSTLFHRCCQDWSALFGRLGRARVVPLPDEPGGVVYMAFGGTLPSGLTQFEPKGKPVIGVLWPLAGHNGEGMGMMEHPEGMIYGVSALLTGGPQFVQATEPVSVRDVGLFVRDSCESMGYVLMRRYLTRHGCPTAVLKERGEWRWYTFTNEVAPVGVYSVSLTLVGEGKGHSVNALMATDDEDNEACGFTVSLGFLDCLTSDMAPLSFRQAAMCASSLPVNWAGICGNHFLCDLLPGVGRSTPPDREPPVILPSGEVVMRSRSECLAISQLPFCALAHCSPAWSGTLCVLVAKQWSLMRRLWASRVKFPDKLLALSGVRDVARLDMQRWGLIQNVAQERVDDELFVEWIVNQQLQGHLEWIPPPAVAVLDPCSSDSAHWTGESLFSTGYGGKFPLDEKFMRIVGKRGGHYMPDGWKARYSALLKYGNPALVAAMALAWDGLPDATPTPRGKEDLPCLEVIVKDWHSTVNDSGWPAYGECYDCDYSEGSGDDQSPIPDDCECFVADNRGEGDGRSNSHPMKWARGSPLSF